jgi:hypothetical protein
LGFDLPQLIFNDRKLADNNQFTIHAELLSVRSGITPQGDYFVAAGVEISLFIHNGTLELLLGINAAAIQQAIGLVRVVRPERSTRSVFVLGLDLCPSANKWLAL